MGHFVLGWLAAQLAQGVPEDIAKHLQNFMKLPRYW